MGARVTQLTDDQVDAIFTEFWAIEKKMDALEARRQKLAAMVGLKLAPYGTSALSRLGGKKGGLARAAALSPKRRSEIARMGAKARWGRP